jgi:hypothetical protein
VPTARPRYSVTETDEVARALDLAAQRWPAESENRGRLLLHAVREWADMVSHSRTSHQESILATSGIATDGEYGPDYLQVLREDWPA